MRDAVDSIFGARVGIGEVEAVSPAGIWHELRICTDGSGEGDQVFAMLDRTTVSASPCNSIVGGMPHPGDRRIGHAAIEHRERSNALIASGGVCGYVAAQREAEKAKPTGTVVAMNIVPTVTEAVSAQQSNLPAS